MSLLNDINETRQANYSDTVNANPNSADAIDRKNESHEQTRTADTDMLNELGLSVKRRMG